MDTPMDEDTIKSSSMTAAEMNALQSYSASPRQYNSSPPHQHQHTPSSQAQSQQDPEAIPLDPSCFNIEPIDPLLLSTPSHNALPPMIAKHSPTAPSDVNVNDSHIDFAAFDHTVYPDPTICTPSPQTTISAPFDDDNDSSLWPPSPYPQLTTYPHFHPLQRHQLLGHRRSISVPPEDLTSGSQYQDSGEMHNVFNTYPGQQDAHYQQELHHQFQQQGQEGAHHYDQLNEQQQQQRQHQEPVMIFTRAGTPLGQSTHPKAPRTPIHRSKTLMIRKRKLEPARGRGNSPDDSIYEDAPAVATYRGSPSPSGGSPHPSKRTRGGTRYELRRAYKGGRSRGYTFTAGVGAGQGFEDVRRDREGGRGGRSNGPTSAPVFHSEVYYPPDMIGEGTLHSSQHLSHSLPQVHHGLDEGSNLYTMMTYEQQKQGGNSYPCHESQTRFALGQALIGQTDPHTGTPFLAATTAEEPEQVQTSSNQTDIHALLAQVNEHDTQSRVQHRDERNASLAETHALILVRVVALESSVSELKKEIVREAGVEKGDVAHGGGDGDNVDGDILSCGAAGATDGTDGIGHDCERKAEGANMAVDNGKGENQVENKSEAKSRTDVAGPADVSANHTDDRSGSDGNETQEYKGDTADVLELDACSTTVEPNITGA